MRVHFSQAKWVQNGKMTSGPVTVGSALPLDGAVDSDPRPVYIFPGFCDVHVHLREPGFSYKETVATGTAAAARGGYTDICAMPNVDPVPDSPEALAVSQACFARDARIGVHPYGALTVGERGERPAALEALAGSCVAFSDDGRGVQSESMMRQLMERAAALGVLIAAHCEDERLLRGGYIHDGAYAGAHGHRGICSESEWGPIKRDLRLAEETGCRYHVCHVSTKESVELIRQAKKRGVDVTCETAPHYLLLCDEDLQEDGRFKMNPPLRGKADREALREALFDGTIDMIATDHAPHSAAEKAGGLKDSKMGVVGLETAFPLLYTHLVRPGLLPLPTLIERMAEAPRRRFGLPPTEDVCVWDLDAADVIDPAQFLSLGRATPFAGMQVYGKNRLTVYGGETVWKSND